MKKEKWEIRREFEQEMDDLCNKYDKIMNDGGRKEQNVDVTGWLKDYSDINQDCSGTTTPTPPPLRRAIEVLHECAELLEKKGKAYNNVPQAENYPDGLPNIHYMMFTKMKRIESLMKDNSNNNFEGMDDSCRDLISYTAFFIEFMEGKMDGQ